MQALKHLSYIIVICFCTHIFAGDVSPFIPKKNYYAEFISVDAAGELQKSFVPQTEVAGLVRLDGYSFKDEKALELYKYKKSHLKEVLTESEAEELFTFLANQPYLLFERIDTGCADRDYEMARLMVLKGINSQRIIAKGKYFRPRYKKMSDEKRWWDMHMAPVVKVAYQNKTLDLVMDPSLTKMPMPVKFWLASMEINDYETPFTVTIQNRSDLEVLHYYDLYDPLRARANLNWLMHYMISDQHDKSREALLKKAEAIQP